MQSHLISHFFTLIAGAIYALAYPSEWGAGWFPLLFISLPLFLWQLEKSSFKESFSLILFFNLGLNLVGYYWIPHTLMEFGQLPYVVSLFLGMLFSFILQPHWWAYAIFRKLRPRMNWLSETGILISAIILTLLERYVPQQFPSYVGSPWLHLAPYLGLTPIFGSVAFSFITYWVSLEVLGQITYSRMRVQVWVVFVIFVVINSMLPLKIPSSTAHLPVRIVQANIGNFLKVSSEMGDKNSFEAINQKYLRLSSEGDQFVPHLIIWPETAYPHSFYGQNSILHSLFLDIMDRTGSEMLIGGYEQDLTKSSVDLIESVFNSSILLSDRKLKTSYHKNILIPFGETLPFGPFNRQIVSIVPAVSLFARGEGTPLMVTRDGYRFVTPICYEILETNYMRTLLNQWKDNHFIVNHTNDSWYGDTAEPYQHLFLSKWRALEFQLPIIRSTNTGISSVIFPDGSESPRLEINTEGALDVKVPIADAHDTLYQRYGVFPLFGIFIFLLIITWWRERNGIRP